MATYKVKYAKQWVLWHIKNPTKEQQEILDNCENNSLTQEEWGKIQDIEYEKQQIE